MKTILVVDDECFLLESLTQLLEETGYHVVSATNGKDGLAQLVKEHPDMVLTDFMMPVADGLEMVRGVHALPEFQSLPVVVMSASPKRVSLPRGGNIRAPCEQYKARAASMRSDKLARGASDSHSVRGLLGLSREVRSARRTLPRGQAACPPCNRILARGETASAKKDPQCQPEPVQ